MPANSAVGAGSRKWGTDLVRAMARKESVFPSLRHQKAVEGGGPKDQNVSDLPTQLSGSSWKTGCDGHIRRVLRSCSDEYR